MSWPNELALHLDRETRPLATEHPPRPGRHHALVGQNPVGRIVGPFESDDGDSQPTPSLEGEPAIRALDGGEGLELSIRFQEVRNADPFKKYYVRAYFYYPSLGLEQRAVEFVVTFLTARPAAEGR